MVEYKKKEVVDAFVPEGDTNALTMVIGKDHNGRVRGVGGYHLGKRKYFGSNYKAVRSSDSVKSPEDIEASIEKKLETKMRNKLSAILQHLGFPSFDELLEKTVGDKGSQQDSTTTKEAPEQQRLLRLDVQPYNSDLEEMTPCYLLLPESGVVGGNLTIVAYGSARPTVEGQKVHSIPISSDAYSVCIDTIVLGFEDFSLPKPRPGYNLRNLLDAKGSYVEWPRAWVHFLDKVKKSIANQNGSKRKDNDPHSKEVDAKVMVKVKDPQPKEIEVNSPYKGNKEASQQKGPIQHVTPRGTPLVTTQVISSLSEACTWFHTCVIGMPDEETMTVHLDKFQFHYMWDTSTYVTREDVREFLTGEMLCVSMIQAFMRALYEDLMGCEAGSRVGWLCPLEICDTKCLGNQPKLREYLHRSLNECSFARNKFILAPYYQDMHWTLLVVCPSSYTIYEFDFVPRVQTRSLLIKALLNSAMRKLRGRTSNPHWKSVRCTRQQDGVECGYYVLRYMYDLVSSSSEADDLEKVVNTLREGPFTIKEINEVRDKLALFLSDNCI